MTESHHARLFFATLILAVCTAVTGAALQDEKAKVFKTPQDAFDAFDNAEHTKAWKEFCDTFTKSREAYAAGLVQNVLRNFAGKRDPDGFKQIITVLEKHGLTADTIKQQLADVEKEKKNPLKQYAILTEPIKDKTAFVVDLYAAWEKVDPKMVPAMPCTRAVKNVKINGDAAQGMLSKKFAGKELLEPFYFVKEKGSWRVEPASVVGIQSSTPIIGKGKDKK